MSEEHKPQDDDLSFDEDFVLDDPAPADAEAPAAPVPPRPATEPRAESATGDLFDDDEEFVLEFDDEEAPARTLEGLFDPAEDPFAGEHEMPDETEQLFEAASFLPKANVFEGARERPAFVEDLAGWYGEDVDLGELVGEHAEAEEPVGDPTLEFEEGLDDDPFAIDEVEVESLDGAAPVAKAKPRAPVPAAGDDAWAPLPDDQSWTMGEALGSQEPEESAEPAWADADFVADGAETEAVPQSAFGAGRSDTFASGQLGDEAAGDDELHGDEQWQMSEELDEPPAEAEEFVDPIYGDVGSGIDAVQQDDTGDGEPIGLVEDGYYEEDGADFEEAYVDGAAGARVDGGGRVHRFGLLRVAAAAMIVIGLGGGAVVGLRPDWLGLVDGPVVVDRVQIARPSVEVALEAPEPSGGDPALDPVDVPIGDPVDPIAIDPVPTDPLPVDPLPTDPLPTDPVAVDPIDPVVRPVTDPVVVADPVVDPVIDPVVDPIVTPPTGPAAIAFEPLEFGDGLEIRRAADPDEYIRAGVHDVVPGMRAFAQLRNEEIFIGVVTRIEASYVTLDLQPGEVSLIRSELSTLSPVATHDGSEFTAAEHGYVRLPTEARLWGRILRNATTDNVILRTEDSRITIPADDVVDISGASKAGTSLVDDEDDRWLEERARERLRSLIGPGGGAAAPGGRR